MMNTSKYTADTHFSALAEVEDFCHYIIVERSIFFHPEDKFNPDTDNISQEEADIWNRLIDECNDICSANGSDIYDIIIPLTLYAGNAKLNR